MWRRPPLATAPAAATARDAHPAPACRRCLRAERPRCVCYRREAGCHWRSRAVGSCLLHVEQGAEPPGHIAARTLGDAGETRHCASPPPETAAVRCVIGDGGQRRPCSLTLRDPAHRHLLPPPPHPRPCRPTPAPALAPQAAQRSPFGDSRMDVLELNITLPLATSERITAVDVLLPAQVKLHVRCGSWPSPPPNPNPNPIPRSPPSAVPGPPPHPSCKRPTPRANAPLVATRPLRPTPPQPLAGRGAARYGKRPRAVPRGGRRRGRRALRRGRGISSPCAAA